MPGPAYRAAERLAGDEVEQQPERVEAVAALELGAFVVRLVRLDVDDRVPGVVGRVAGVDGLEAQRADLIIVRSARLE